MLKILLFAAHVQREMVLGALCWMGPLEMSLFPPAHCCGWPGRSHSRVLEQVVFHQRWSEWWNGKRMNETSVHVVSVSLCFKVSDDTFSALSFFFLFFPAILVPSYCVFLRKLLYLDMRPLGLQALNTGQNLLLVACQSHAHLGQLTARKITHSLEPLVLLLMKLTLINTKFVLSYSAVGCT